MQKLAALLLCLLLTYSIANGQNYRSFKKLWERKDYVNLKLKLDKALEKDSTNAGTRYFLSLFYHDSSNIAYHQLQTAHSYAKQGLAHWPKLSNKQIGKLEKIAINQKTLEQLRTNIEQQAYTLAAQKNTIAAYQTYIDRYPDAYQSREATRMRNALAYTQAVAENTYQAYENFYQNYPDSRQAATAYDKYQSLLFQSKTRGNSVADYATFLQQYPDSPFRKLAEEQLYQLYVQDAQQETFLSFVEDFPENRLVSNAWYWIYYLSEDKAAFLQQYPDFPNRAHMVALEAMEQEPLFSFLENGQYGFMDSRGETKIAATLPHITDQARCKGVYASFITFVSNESLLGCLDKTGKEVAPAVFEEISAFAPGIIKVKQEGQYGLRHKQNYALLPTHYQSLELLAHNLVLAQKDGRYGLLNFFGKPLTEFTYTHIDLEQGGMLVFEQNGKYAFLQQTALSTTAYNTLALTFDYQDYEPSHSLFWKVRQDQGYGIIDQQGQPIIPPLMAHIQDSEQGWVVQENTRKRLYRLDGSLLSPLHFQDVLNGRKAFGIKTDGKWGVIDFSGKMLIQPLYDTLSFIGELGIFLVRDGKKLGYFYEETFTDLTPYANLLVQKAEVNNHEPAAQPSEKTYIVTQGNNGKKGLMNGKGEIKISSRYNELYYLTSGFWVAAKGKKRGLIDTQGQVQIPFYYDGISSYDKGFCALLKNKKFGTYHLKTKALIEPTYDALLKTYGQTDTVLIAKKERFGLIDLNNQPLTDFTFDDLRYWNDSVALVQVNNKWKLYDFKNNYYLPEAFDRMKIVKSDDRETVLITYRSTGYGLLSNRQGRLVPEEYNQIYNIGQDDAPVYVLEKNDRLANFYLLIYVNQRGQVLKRIMLDNEEAYNRAVCGE